MLIGLLIGLLVGLKVERMVERMVEHTVVKWGNLKVVMKVGTQVEQKAARSVG